MICSICEKEAKEGKTYTFTPEAGKMAKNGLHINQQTFWVCNACLANPLRRFAKTLLEMWDVFPMTPRQRIDHICDMFRSGVRLPHGVSIESLR